ncbi:MAG: TonB-dependent receptor [Verrucomicrobia bacterium]|nr:TonB-dependent receptor [Verrucomicrobiota bacterium]
MKTVLVTGSMIPTSDSVPIVPVIAITAEDIKRQGASTLSEVIKRLPQNSGSLDNKFQNGFAPGSSGASLRGMGAKYTLVLLNGHRVAPYGYGQNISDAFADLNSLPLDAIESIEELPEGASAIYGSDAIAGVINIKLKKEYDGAELSSRWGNTFKNDMFEQSYSVTAGLHNKKNTVSVLVNLDYEHTDSLDQKDRAFSATANQSARGGFDWTSDLGPSPGYFFSPDGGLIFSSSGDIYDPQVRMLPDGSFVNGTGGNYFDFNPSLKLSPEFERYGAYIYTQWKINENVEASLDFSYRRTWTRTFAAPTPITGDDPPNLYGNPYGQGFIVPASNPYNVLGTDVSFRNRLTEFGPRIDDITSTSLRIIPGINFHLANEWEAAMDFAFMPNTTKTVGQNYIDADRLQAALNSTDPATAINLFAPATNYAPGQANNPALIQSLKFSPWRKGETELMMGSGSAGGPLFDLPGGKLRISVGADGRHETYSDESDPITTSERQVGSGGTTGQGQRSGAAAYAELLIPVFGADNALPGIRSLEFSLAGRMDHYSDFGTAVTPKFAFKYSPHEDLVFRGSYGQGFRAPSLQELYLGSSVSYDFVVDPDTNSVYYGLPRQYRIQRSGNPSLEAETSQNWSASLVYTPKFVPGLELHGSWGQIELEKAIDSFPNSYILDYAPDMVARNPYTGEITTITNTWSNLGKRIVKYVDMGASYTKPTSWGEFTFKTDFSWLYSTEDQVTSSSRLVQLAGSYDSPEWRGYGSLFWNYRHFGAGATVNWVGAFDQQYGPDYGLPSSQVADWVTVDLQFNYEFPKDLTLTLGVKNVGDVDPPFADAETEGYSLVSHEPYGRQWYVQVTKKF